MSYHLYRCPCVPWLPVDCMRFSSNMEARAWGRRTWPEEWVLTHAGSEADKMLAEKLEQHRRVEAEFTGSEQEGQ